MTVSKAEKAALALCAAFVLFFAGWFAGELRRLRELVSNGGKMEDET